MAVVIFDALLTSTLLKQLFSFRRFLFEIVQARLDAAHGSIRE
jgi:hypothetical protein